VVVHHALADPRFLLGDRASHRGDHATRLVAGDDPRRAPDPAGHHAARLRRGAVVEDSLVSPGCDVAGEVVRSVLGPGVVVEAGARVEDCVLFEDVVVRRGATLTGALVDERCMIGPDAAVGGSVGDTPEDDEVTMLGLDSSVGASVVLPGGSRLEPGTTA
jgi:glucose-1-phosphate adenylyltransferase